MSSAELPSVSIPGPIKGRLPHGKDRHWCTFTSDQMGMRSGPCLRNLRESGAIRGEFICIFACRCTGYPTFRQPGQALSSFAGPRLSQTLGSCVVAGHSLYRSSRLSPNLNPRAIGRIRCEVWTMHEPYWLIAWRFAADEGATLRVFRYDQAEPVARTKLKNYHDLEQDDDDADLE